MATLIIVFIALVIIHFIYDGIILPSVRFKFRLRIFEIRDELRSLKITHSNDLSDELYHDLHESINISIRFLHQMDLKTLFWANRYVKNHHDVVADIISRRNSLLEECKLGEINNLTSELYKNVGYALIFNNGVLLVLLSPFAIPLIFAMSLFSEIKSLIRMLVSIPENEIEKEVIPPESLSPA